MVRSRNAVGERHSVIETAGGGPGIYTVTIVWRGTVALQSAILDPCGAASGNYGDSNEFRRVVQVPTFIDPSI